MVCPESPNRDMEISMKTPSLSVYRCIVRVVACLSLAGCGEVLEDQPNTGGTVVSEPEAPESPDRSIRNGTEFFYYYCRGCHGAEATGTQKGPQIQRPNQAYARWVIRNGRYNQSGTHMPHFTEAELSATQLDEILVWLQEFEKPTTGAGLYTVFCKHCHGNDAKGGEVRKDITNDISTPSLVLDMIRSGSGGTDYLKRSDYMPARTEEELTDAEAQLIIGHIQELAGN